MIRYLLFLLLVVSFCYSPAYAAKDQVQLQLKWRHAFQFAGYYMAKEKGFYADAGLDVEIIEGAPDRHGIEFTLGNVGRYAVSDSGLLLANSKGKPVRVLASIFQHSPLALAVRKDSGIRTFQDLKGKKIMMQSGFQDAVIMAAILRAGLKETDFMRQDSSFNLHDLIDGKTDAFSVYTTDQPHQLKTLGVSYRLLKPIVYDVDFYGDVLFTSEKEVRKNAGRVKRMIAASLKGWNYALEHIDESIALIREKYNSQNLSLSQLQFEASKTAAAILKNEIELGYISEFRWKQILKTYQELGYIGQAFDMKKFMYEEQPILADIFNANRWQFIIILLLIVLVFFFVQGIVLSRMVKSRTEELSRERENLKASESLQLTISAVLEMVVGDRPIFDVFDKVIRTFEKRHPDMKASILLVENGKLTEGNTSSLPDEYNQAIEGLAIGPKVGSCGTAAYTKQRVIVEDIENDELWSDYAEFTVSFGLRACWSEPVLSGSGDVIGTFAMYYDHVRAPTDKEIADISDAARLVGIAIERKMIQDNLRKLSMATEQAGESVVITDKDGIIEYVNPSYSKHTGFQPEEVIGTKSNLLHPGYQSEEYYSQVAETLKRGEIWQSTIVNQRKDGSEYPILVAIASITDDERNTTHYVLTINDMTEYETLEQQFRQAQKMEALGTLVGGIAHDFNNTLAGMTGNIFLAKKKAEALPEVLSKLENIEKLSFHAADTVKQLLAFARKGLVQRRVFGLTSFLKEVSALHQSSIPENISYTEDFCEDELTVNADTTQIQQVVLNLLNNARDAVSVTNSPSIHLKVDKFNVNNKFLSKHPDVTERYFAHMQLTDNGVGIHESELENIFEPFFTRKEVGQGTGLGLSMVYGTIQKHGGLLDVDSELGKGSTFHVYLPLLEDGAVKVEGSVGQKVNYTGSGELILIVDDNTNVRDAAREVLESMGFQVIEAVDGEDAVYQFRVNQEEVELVIMDIVMPKLGGQAAAEQITKISPNVKIIYSSGYDKDKTLIQDDTGKEITILSKPYRVDVLLETVKRQLGGS